MAKIVSDIRTELNASSPGPEKDKLLTEDLPKMMRELARLDMSQFVGRRVIGNRVERTNKSNEIKLAYEEQRDGIIEGVTEPDLESYWYGQFGISDVSDVMNKNTMFMSSFSSLYYKCYKWTSFLPGEGKSDTIYEISFDGKLDHELDETSEVSRLLETLQQRKTLSFDRLRTYATIDVPANTHNDNNVLTTGFASYPRGFRDNRQILLNTIYHQLNQGPQYRECIDSPLTKYKEFYEKSQTSGGLRPDTWPDTDIQDWRKYVRTVASYFNDDWDGSASSRNAVMTGETLAMDSQPDIVFIFCTRKNWSGKFHDHLYVINKFNKKIVRFNTADRFFANESRWNIYTDITTGIASVNTVKEELLRMFPKQNAWRDYLNDYTIIENPRIGNWQLESGTPKNSCHAWMVYLATAYFYNLFEVQDDVLLNVSRLQLSNVSVSTFYKNLIG